MDRVVSSGKKKSDVLSEKEWKKFTELFAYDTNALEGSKLSGADVRSILRKGKSVA